MVVLITGASGGLGEVLGRHLVDKGMTVYGTMRNPDARTQEDPFTMLAMEATDDASVEKCVNDVLSREGRIDVLINCVNQMVIGSVEETSVEEFEALYRTNVFGVLRVCRRVIPAMRKQGRGTIVNMSSLGGLIAVPYMSAYTSAKFALEAMSEALYREMKPLGIDVVVMQPVAMHMDRPPTGSHLELVDGVRSDSRSHKMLAKMNEDTEASKLTPEMVSAKIHEVIVGDTKPFRVPMDRAKAIGVLKRLAPQSVLDKIVAGLLPD